jgi:dihydroxyacetone kinase-like protein
VLIRASEGDMKKFIHSVEDLVADSLAGLVMAHQDLLALNEEPLFVCRRTPKQGKVALVSGGGSGHEPLHTGYVGPGMLDAACPGHVFTAPSAEQIAAAARRVDAGQGVLLIAKNYAGDMTSFEMARDMLAMEHELVLVNDDVAVESSTHTTGRRGVAGTVMVEKMVGAAAEAGADLYECKAVGDRVNACTASMGVAFTRRPPPPLSTSGRTRSRWAWASTASRAVTAAAGCRPTKSWGCCWSPS